MVSFSSKPTYHRAEVSPSRPEGRVPSSRQLIRSIEMLHFQGSDWQPLRPWMRFFVELGSMLSTESSEAKRLVIGVSVPARPFAVLFAALGSVLMDAVGNGETSQDASAHFNYLASLPAGTPVSWHRGTNTVLGQLAGTRDLTGQTVLMIKTARGFKQSCSVGACLGIQVLDEDVQLPPHPGKGRPVRGRIPLLTELIPAQAVFSFVSQNALSALMIGTASQITIEAETGFAVPKGSHLLVAPLEELLRIRRTGHPGGSYRSSIVGSNSPRAAKLKNVEPHVVIFDGALPYLRWHASWPTAPTLVVLDRSQPHGDEAAAALDQERSLYRSGKWQLDSDMNIPDGIEVTGYYR
jgi:hypothetical protein